MLLLVWYNKLDEARALKFFEGSLELNKLLSYCVDIEQEKLDYIKQCKNLKQLHNYCLKNDVYKFN